LNAISRPCEHLCWPSASPDNFVQRSFGSPFPDKPNPVDLPANHAFLPILAGPYLCPGAAIFRGFRDTPRSQIRPTRDIAPAVCPLRPCPSRLLCTSLPCFLWRPPPSSHVSLSIAGASMVFFSPHSSDLPPMMLMVLLTCPVYCLPSWHCARLHTSTRRNSSAVAHSTVPYSSVWHARSCFIQACCSLPFSRPH